MEGHVPWMLVLSAKDIQLRRSFGTGSSTLGFPSSTRKMKLWPSNISYEAVAVSWSCWASASYADNDTQKSPETWEAKRAQSNMPGHSLRMYSVVANHCQVSSAHVKFSWLEAVSIASTSWLGENQHVHCMKGFLLPISMQELVSCGHNVKKSSGRDPMGPWELSILANLTS